MEFFFIYLNKNRRKLWLVEETNYFNYIVDVNYNKYGL